MTDDKIVIVDINVKKALRRMWSQFSFRRLNAVNKRRHGWSSLRMLILLSLSISTTNLLKKLFFLRKLVFIARFSMLRSDWFENSAEFRRINTIRGKIHWKSTEFEETKWIRENQPNSLLFEWVVTVSANDNQPMDEKNDSNVFLIEMFL